MTNKEIRAKITSLRKKLTTKPRGKSKGGAYERAVGKKIVRAFRKHGITKDDCFRTPRGSAEGDLKFGSALAKLFPFTVEAKFYASVPSLHMLRTFEDMGKSWPWKNWWLQLEAETKITKKVGLLVFRENNGIDLCSFYWPCLDSFLRNLEEDKKLRVLPRFVTTKDGNEIWTVSFDAFLKIVRKQ